MPEDNPQSPVAPDQRLRSFIEHAADAFYVHDVDGRILDANQTACAMLGYTREELLALQVADLERMKSARQLRDAWEHLIPGEPILWDGIHRRRDGDLVLIEGYSQRLGVNGRDLIYAFVRDVSDRQRTDRLLEAIVRSTGHSTGLEFLELLTRSLAQALGTRYAFVSEVTDDDLARVRLRALWTGDGFAEPSDYDVHGTPCERVFEHGLSWYGSGVAGRFPDDVWLNEHGIEAYQAIPYYDSAGRPLGHLGVMHTEPTANGPFNEALLQLFAGRAGLEVERMRLQSEVDTRQRQLTALLEVNRNLNSTRDADVVMRALVNGAMAMTGARGGAWARLEAGSLVFREYMSPGGTSAIHYVFGPGEGVPGYVLQTGQPYLTNDAANDAHVVQSIRQALGFVSLINVPIHDQEGQVIGCFELHNKTAGDFDAQDTGFLAAVAADAAVALENAELLEAVRTHAEMLEAKVAERTAELESRNEEMQSFAYSVSHDLRSPLIAIEGFSRAVLDDYAEKLDATGADYLGRINRASRRMASLIEDMLQLSRISGREMHPATVDLSDEAAKAIEDLRAAEPQRRVEVTIEPGLRAVGDRALIRIALDNLLGNAWKYTRTRDDARIHFGVGIVDGETVFYIRDNGVGFDMAYADKLFKPFHRLHSEAEFEGTGIGLAIAERAIGRHQGRIWATSEPDQGTTVYFTLGNRDGSLLSADRPTAP